MHEKEIALLREIFEAYNRHNFNRDRYGNFILKGTVGSLSWSRNRRRRAKQLLAKLLCMPTPKFLPHGHLRLLEQINNQKLTMSDLVGVQKFIAHKLMRLGLLEEKGKRPPQRLRLTSTGIEMLYDQAKELSE